MQETTTAPKRGFSPRRLLGENRPTLWMAPLLAIVTLFYLYPAFEVLRFSVTNASLLQADYEYTLSTFVQVLGDPVLYKVIRTTAIFVLASVVLQLALGLVIAVAANRARRRRLPGMVFMRSIILSAWVMPGVVIGIVWAIRVERGQLRPGQPPARDGRDRHRRLALESQAWPSCR